MKLNYKKIAKRSFFYAWILTTVLSLLELSYRYQWIDYWSSEFKALNPKIDKKKENVLIFGDSFSAFPKGYVEQLRGANPQFNFINCAVPGTGPLEMSYMAKRRIKRYPPTKVIYQMYIGNDLIDIYPNLNWSELSAARNFYYLIGQEFRILANLSIRMKQSGIISQKDFNTKHYSQSKSNFSVSSYSPRTKMLLKANPNFINESITLNSSRMKEAANKAVSSIQYLQGLLPKNCQLHVVILPHCTQVNSTYFENFQKLGAKLKHTSLNYTFYQFLNRELKNVKVHNPLSYLQNQEKEGNKIYFDNDPHLNPNGQSVLFKFVDQFVLQ